MGYISVKEAAAKWGLGVRRVRGLCQEGRVPEAIKSGRDWLVPSDAQRPARRVKNETECSIERLELYLNPTYCEHHPPSSISEEEQMLCEASEWFLRGDFQESKQILDQLIAQEIDDSYLVIAQMMIYLICACSNPDVRASEEALADVERTLERNPNFHYVRSLVDCAKGEPLEPTCLMDAPTGFLPILVESACSLGAMDDLAGRHEADPASLELLARMVDDENQPALALYTHVALALYHNLKHESKLYDYHVRKSLAIALPRKWYAPLADHANALNWYEVKEADPEAYREIQRLSGAIMGNYVKTGHFGKTFSGIEAMDADEFKVAYMNARGMSIREISTTLDLSVYKVRKTLNDAYRHTGTTGRKELQALLNEQLKAI